MTNEQRVKRVYPDAVIETRGWFTRPWWTVYSGPIGSPDCVKLGEHPSRRSWAWAEAWRNIEYGMREGEDNSR